MSISSSQKHTKTKGVTIRESLPNHDSQLFTDSQAKNPMEQPTHVAPEQIETEDNFFAHLNFSCIPVYSTTQFLVHEK
jgi:hypothetical protein